MFSLSCAVHLFVIHRHAHCNFCSRLPNKSHEGKLVYLVLAEVEPSLLEISGSTPLFHVPVKKRKFFLKKESFFMLLRKVKHQVDSLHGSWLVMPLLNNELKSVNTSKLKGRTK